MRQKWLYLTIGLLTLATLACGGGQVAAPTTPPQPPPATAAPTEPPIVSGNTASLEIVNNSGVDIWYLYISPSDSDVWGQDQLGASIIRNGESFVISDIAFGTYDLKADAMAYDTIEIQMGVRISGDVTWTVVGEGADAGDELAQWASDAFASTQYGEDAWSALQATGAPDTNECGDLPTAWATADPDGEDWIELSYRTAVIPTQINIYETHSPGFIVKVEVVDANGRYHTVWQGRPSPVAQCPRVFTVDVTGISFAVSGVRISLDQRDGGYWNEIDAVQLIGVTP